jgi:large repetitive protein
MKVQKRLLLASAITAASMLGAASAVAGAPAAHAAVTVSCTTSGSTLDVAVTGATSDSLLVTTSGGSYQIESDGSAACTGTSYSDTMYPAVQVTDTGDVPVVFQPGTDSGVDFEGPGISTTLDLSGAPTGIMVSVPAGSVYGLSGGGSDSYSGITAFTGSAAGATSFIASPAAGGYSITGQGNSNVLDFSAVAASQPSPLTVNAGSGPGSGTATFGPDTVLFADIQSFTGSSSGFTEFEVGNIGGLVLTGQGPGNTLSFAGATSTRVQVDLNPNALGKETAAPGSGTDTFTGLTTIVGSGGGDVFFGGPGNYSIEDTGAGNTFSDGSAPAGITVSFSGGTATVTGGYLGTTTTTGVTGFVGSPAGGNTFQAPAAGGYTFSGQGTGDTLDLSAAPAGATVTQNGDSPASPGVVSNLNSGAGGSTTDEFSDIQVVKLPPSGVSLASSLNPSTYGQNVTFTATVGSADGGGTVAFDADGSPLSGCGTEALTQVSGLTYTATCSTSALSAGSHSITASYTGDTDSTPGSASLAGGQTVSQAGQSISFTAPATGTAGGSAPLTATGGPSGMPVAFSVDPASGAGVCTVSGMNGTTVNYAAGGTCVIDANQAGDADYAAAPTVTQAITVNQAPAFVAGSPPLTATAGQPYDYAFTASGTPAPAYALASGAPSWLSVNASTGEVTGTPPVFTTSFSYTVTATNSAGQATAGPFTVTVGEFPPAADISATLRCPASMTVGGAGTCTLTVANAGPATASKVTATVALPAALSETSCSPGCVRAGNTYMWTLASLGNGPSAQFSITVKASRAGPATVLADAASQNPDRNPLNNISLAQVTIKE